MTRSLDRHLDDAQIETLAGVCFSEGGGDPGSDGRGLGTEETASELEPHLQRCEECRQKLQVQIEMQSIFLEQTTEQRRGPYRNCPKNVDWNAVVLGLVPEAKTGSLLAHAAGCFHCGPLLKQAQAVTTHEATEEEEAFLRSLSVGNPAWRAGMARTMQQAAEPGNMKTRLRWSPLLRPIGWASAGALALAALSVWAVYLWRRPSPTALIAKAYGEQRTMEPRFAGAAYGPVRVERGDGFVEKPASLLQAEAAIAENLKLHPNDARLLDAKARADLLDCHYNSAIEALERASAAAPGSSQVTTDLATAYFMRAETGGKTVEYGRAIDLLGKALAISPNDPVALFNRAIADERLAMYDNAAADWERFLKVEKDAGWLAEGRQRLENVRAKIRQRQSLNAPLSSDPEAALPVLLQESQQSRGPDRIRSPDEDYVEIALTHWLDHTSTNPSPLHTLNDAATGRALSALAEVLRRNHEDNWLADLLSEAPSEAWRRGVHEISAAAAARSAGDTTAQLLHAKAARAAFQQVRSGVGQAAADMEYANGLNRAQQGIACVPVAQEGLRLLRREDDPRGDSQDDTQKYSWLAANLWLEASTCDGTRGAQELAETDALHASTLVEKAGYEQLGLQTQYYLDGVVAPWIASSAAWDRMRAGLEEFWKARSSPRYGGNFFSDMVFASEVEGMWNLAVAAGKETVSFRSQSGNQFAEAASRHYLAQAAEAAGDSALADAEFEKADALLNRLSLSDRTTLVTLESERASLEVRENKIDAATAQLEKARQGLTQLHSQYGSLPYREALGELYLRKNMPQAAEQELTKAIGILEGDADSLRSDPERLLWHENAGRPYRDLLEIYSRIDRDASKSFAFQEWYRAAPMRAAMRARQHGQAGALTAASAEPSLSEISFTPRELEPKLASGLEHGEAVLSWISFPSGIAVWLWDGKNAQMVWAPVSAEILKTTLAQFVRLCSDPTADQHLREYDGKLIYTWMLAPFGAKLGAISTLFVESDETMQQIPLQALQAPDGRFLADRVVVIDSPGMAYEQASRDRHRDWSEMMVLSVGNPLSETDDRTGLPPLPEADREAHNVSALFSHHSLLTGADANLKKVANLLPSAQILHFAGHAQLGGTQPGLLLASGVNQEPTLLGAEQLRAHDLSKLRLVVLSGCATAVASHGLDDPESLVRVFLGAGVPHVVASDWQVDSRATEDLMQAFYERLIRGDSVSAALASAERAVRSRQETSQPYYWAAFAQFGR